MFTSHLITTDYIISFSLPANLPKTIDILGSSINSELEGNPPIWVNYKKNPTYDDIYINNAKLEKGRSNIVAINKGKRQVWGG